ncbi:MAG: hypothetical protein WC780_06095 [Lentimicrobiaceae bacterium]|jgi:hypothetical protein
MKKITDSLSVLRLTRKASEKFYPPGDNTPPDHIGYLKKCSKILHKYFSSSLSEKYLYSALSHKKNRDSFDLVDSKNSGDGYNFISNLPVPIRKIVKKISRDAKANKTINLTNVLLSEKITFDFYFLFNKSIPDYSYKDKVEDNNIIWQKHTDKWLSFDDFTFTEDLNKFKIKNRTKIKKFIRTFKTPPEFDFDRTAEYLYNYYSLGQEYKNKYQNDNFILHLVSPGGISEFQYNLLLSIATSEPLSRQEFADINFILYRLVSQTAIEKIKEAEKLKSLNNIQNATQNATHVLKTLLGFLRTKASVLISLANPEFSTTIKNLAYMKDIDDLIQITEIINASSKIFSGASRKEILAILKKTGLIVESSENSISEYFNLTNTINYIIGLSNRDATRSKVNELSNEINISNSLFKIDEYILSEKCWTLLCVTAFENFYTHVGIKEDYQKEFIVIIDNQNNTLTFKNQRNSKDPLPPELKGVLGTFKLIFEKTLSVLTISYYLKDDFYHLQIKLQNI